VPDEHLIPSEEIISTEGGTESNDPVEDDVNRDGMGELGNAPRHGPGEQPLEPELE
jgi:hypothetical protein